jgi:hypothetical protein
MTGSNEVGRILASTPHKHERILYFGALLAKESGSDIIVVGGSAIEVYTRGKYVSGDVDIRADRPAVDRVLAKWGFKDHGRLWIRKDWGLAVDVVGDEYSGDPYRATTVSTPYGSVRIAVVEDLFVKRLAAAKHWRVPEALDEANLLWSGYRDQMDDAYLSRQASAYHVLDLLNKFRGTGDSSGSHRKPRGSRSRRSRLS